MKQACAQAGQGENKGQDKQDTSTDTGERPDQPSASVATVQHAQPSLLSRRPPYARGWPSCPCNAHVHHKALWSGPCRCRRAHPLLYAVYASDHLAI